MSESHLSEPASSESAIEPRADGGLGVALPKLDPAVPPEGRGLDAARFTQYYLAARPSLRAFVGTLIPDHAAVEDCLQETCLSMWTKKEDHWQLEDFRRLAFVTARFKALSWLKKHKPASHSTLSPELADRLAAAAAQRSDLAIKGEQGDRLAALQQCLNSLSEDQRSLLNARYGGGSADALTDVAKKLSRSMTAIYKQLERVRTAVRKCVERKLTEDAR